MGVVGMNVDPLVGHPALPVSDISTWSPFYLGSALLGFWDAEQASSLTLATANVTAWADRVGGYTPVQATGANQPIYSSTSFNGRGGVTFDGVGQYLELLPVPATFPISNNSSEMWGLIQQNALGTVAGNQNTAGYGATSNQRTIGRTAVSNVNRARVANQGTAVDATVDLSGRHLIRGTFGPSAVGVAVDGGATTSAAAATIGNGTRLRLGASAADVVGTYFTGIISAIIVTTPLTTSQAAQLTRWLKWRGAIA